MKEPNTLVEQHYSRGKLFESILSRLKELGLDLKNVTRKDIAGVDEFHIRGAAVSLELAKEAGFSKDSKVLDVGCGLGGPARMLADEFNCHVTGIDITEDYVRTARLLSELVGLDHLTTFTQADAKRLPYNNETFDFVWTQHAQMNVEDKNQFYSEINRVLKPRGRFIYYDIFTSTKGTVYYPVPWANDESISHLITIKELTALLKRIGLTEVQTKDQTTKGIEFFNALFDKMSVDGPPKVGLQLLMGRSTEEKLKNILKNLLEDKVVLQSGTYEKPV